MRKIVCVIIFCFSIMSFAQTQTKRYNSMTKRYEYFDARGNMIGFEFYNNMTRQWEYYETKSQNSYQEPAKVDISSLINAQTILQGRYDNNQQKIQSAINDISSKVKALNISTSTQKKILSDIDDWIAKNYGTFYEGFGSANATNRNITWMYDVANQIIRNNLN